MSTRTLLTTRRPDFQYAAAARTLQPGETTRRALVGGVRTWVTPLPQGMADPIFLCELALELGMPVGELEHRMSAHELCVVWPAYFSYKQSMETDERQDR